MYFNIFYQVKYNLLFGGMLGSFVLSKMSGFRSFVITEVTGVADPVMYSSRVFLDIEHFGRFIVTLLTEMIHWQAGYFGVGQTLEDQVTVHCSVPQQFSGVGNTRNNWRQLVMTGDCLLFLDGEKFIFRIDFLQVFSLGDGALLLTLASHVHGGLE